MELVKVESSNIDAIGWQHDTLYIQFKTGNVYAYIPVPKTTYDNLRCAESKGKFFATYIRGNPEIKFSVVTLTEETIQRVNEVIGSRPLTEEESNIISGKGIVNLPPPVKE